MEVLIRSIVMHWGLYGSFPKKGNPNIAFKGTPNFWKRPYLLPSMNAPESERASVNG